MAGIWTSIKNFLQLEDPPSFFIQTITILVLPLVPVLMQIILAEGLFTLSVLILAFMYPLSMGAWSKSRNLLWLAFLASILAAAGFGWFLNGAVIQEFNLHAEGNKFEEVGLYIRNEEFFSTENWKVNTLALISLGCSWITYVLVIIGKRLQVTTTPG